MKVTGSEAIVMALLREDVKLIFGYPGGAIMPTYDALYHKNSELKHILVRHEQGAVHAATGYARATGKVGVCMATSGPGATNCITGLADALLDSVPLVCITGQVASQLLGTDAFQEADIIGMTVPVTKWNFQVIRAEDIPFAIAKAFHIARDGKPGPVLLDITKDAQLQSFDYNEAPLTFSDNNSKLSNLNVTKLKEAAHWINQAKRPFLFVGHGVSISGAEDEVRQLAEKADLPVACTLHGLSAFPSDHVLFQGMLGMHGNYGANVLSNEADVIIAVGMRFDDRVTGDLTHYLKNAKIIHIEIDESEIDKNIQTTVSLLSDAKSALKELIKWIRPNQHTQWRNQFTECYQIEHKEVIQSEINPVTGPLKMAEVIHQLSNKTCGNALLVTDVGQHQMISARYYQFRKPNSHITSGGLGTMGFALPAALGAKLGVSDRLVIMIAGDGGFQMNIQELCVVLQEKIALKMIVLNNGYLGMVRQWQELFFEKRYSFTELLSPNFVKIAECYEIPGRRISMRDQLSEALDEMIDAQGPYLLEILVEQQDNVFPMIAPGESVSNVRLS